MGLRIVEKQQSLTGCPTVFPAIGVAITYDADNTRNMKAQ